MNTEQKEVLNEMIDKNDTKDNTSLIQEMKHSERIRKDVSKIQNIKRNMKTNNFAALDKEAQAQKCGFLFKHYPNIYNKLLKGEIQIKILYRFLDELESIEKGKQNQHEASYRIGLLLKEMYVDKRIDMDKETKELPKKTKKMVSSMSYEEYKKTLTNCEKLIKDN